MAPLLLLLACHTDPPKPDDTAGGGDDTDETGETSHSGDSEETGDTSDTSDTSHSGETEDSGGPDEDGDGYVGVEDGGDDCDDTDADVHPGAEDTPGDGVDNNCDGLLGPAVWTLDGRDGDRFGVPMSPGDVDGDGHGDLAVGAEYAEDLAGAVYLFSGAELADRQDWQDARAEFVGAKLGDDSRAGLTPSRALGDLDGDGIDDLGYGAGFEDVDASNTGAFHIWFGGEGLSGTLNSADADHFLWDPEGASEFGYAASGVGDLDGDGHNDLLIASYRSGAQWEGRVSLILGSRLAESSGWASVESLAWGAVAGSAYELLGVDLTGPVDVDDDGRLDLVMGASYGPVPDEFAGTLGVKYAAPCEGCFNTSPDANVYGTGAYSGLGAQIGHGDLDGDGFTDLAVSAPGFQEAFVIYGAGTRWSMDEITTLSPGWLSGDGLHAGLAVAELNGDGDDDLVVSGVSGSGGAVWIIPGGPERLPTKRTPPASLAMWGTGEDARGHDGRYVTAVADAPWTGRPLLAASARDTLYLVVQTDAEGLYEQ